MITAQKLHTKIIEFVQFLQRFVDRWWYGPLIGVLAAADNLVLIIPNDGILISSSMLTPKRWFWLALCVAIGSTIGASILAAMVMHGGLPWVLEYFPDINTTKTWIWTIGVFEEYGLLLVFLVAITPFVQQPAVILASLANTPVFHIAAVIFVGRFIKFLVMAYVGSHAPKLLEKMWGLKGELKDVGITPPRT